MEPSAYGVPHAPTARPWHEWDALLLRHRLWRGRVMWLGALTVSSRWIPLAALAWSSWLRTLCGCRSYTHFFCGLSLCWLRKQPPHVTVDPVKNSSQTSGSLSDGRLTPLSLVFIPCQGPTERGVGCLPLASPVSPLALSLSCLLSTDGKTVCERRDWLLQRVATCRLLVEVGGHSLHYQPVRGYIFLFFSSI